MDNKDWFNNSIIRGIFLLFFTFFVYYYALESGFIWDDESLVTNNPALRDVDGLRKIWFWPGATMQYYPMVFSVLWLCYQCWGELALGYHFINILLHGFNAILLWRILDKLQFKYAFLGGLIFAIHPIYVESVAWISEIKNLLSGSFYLLSILCFILFYRPGSIHSINTSPKKEVYYVFSLLFFLAALLSKTVTATLPVTLFIILWWKNERFSRKVIYHIIPFFIFIGFFSQITILLERNLVGAQGNLWSFSLLDRCLIAGRALWFYPAKFLWPQNLSFIYPRWDIHFDILWPYIFPLGVIMVLYVLYKQQDKIGKGPLAGVLFYGVTICPALGFIDFYPMKFSFVADHFQYLASIGTLMLFIALLARLGKESYLKKIFIVCFILILMILTRQQTKIYHNLETLYLDIIKKNPTCHMAYNNLGVYYLSMGQSHKAVQFLEKGITFNSTNVSTYINLGSAYIDQGFFDLAERALNKALALNPRAYGQAGIYYYYGKLFVKTGQTDKAVKAYKKVLELQPSNQQAQKILKILKSE